MASISLPFIKWRNGRPRFSPGPRERLLGFTDLDLKHDDLRWFTLGETEVWARERYAAILAQRQSGKRLKAPPARKGTLVVDLVEDFLGSKDFKLARALGGYSDETRKDYTAKANALRYVPQTAKDRASKTERTLEPFVTRPVSAIGKPEVKLFYDYLCKARGAVMARGCIMVLSKAFQWGTLADRWRLKHNPCHELDLPTPDPRIRIATDAEIRGLVAAADRPDVDTPELGDAIMLALFTGQRQRDVLDLVPAEHGSRNRFKQSKTGAIVSIPEAPALSARLAIAAERRKRKHNSIFDTTVVINGATGMRFNSSTFRHGFADVRTAAITDTPSLADFHFQDLRDTAVTWYARAGCTVPEIAAITGHSMRSIYSILKHYLALDEHLADNAVRKLVVWMDQEGIAV